MRIILFTILLLSATPSFGQLRVLVLQMQVEQNSQDPKLLNQAKYLTELINSKIILLPKEKYIAITKENLMMLLPEEKVLEDCIGECEVNVGRIVGSQRVISSVLFDFKESARLNIKLLNTENGAILNSLNLKASSILELEEKINLRFMELFDESTKINSIESHIPTINQGLDTLSETDLLILEQFEKCQQGKLETLFTLKYCEAFLDKAKEEKYQNQRELVKEKLQQLKTYFQIQKEKQQEELENKIKLKEFEKKRDQDWSKLSKLLKLTTIPPQQKEKAVLSFFEIYGTNPALNPYLYFDEPYVKQAVDLLLK